jgi:predicted O-linked N-acetylglucosamine transferase (SPINDLY family)
MLRNLLRHWWSGAPKPPVPAARAPTAVELLSEGRLEEAEQVLREACATRHDDAEAWHLLGHVLDLRRNAQGAIDALERATRLAPENADALYSLGTAHRAAGEEPRAIEIFDRVRQLRPEWYAPWLTLGHLYAARDFVDLAEDMYRRALALAPELAETNYNFGNLLLRCGLADEAIIHYRKALELNPRFVSAYSNFLCALNYSDGHSPEAIRDAHFEFEVRYAKALARREQHSPARTDPARLRVGYVSPDLRNHAVGRLVEPALKHHDRERFVVHCYSDVTEPDARTERFRGYASAWRDIASMSDDAAAEMIRRDEIDILVDLTGHTRDHRLLVFARKPAPVQVTWIGYPNTTGMSAMDYRITDHHADPPGATEHLHSERLLRLPEIYLPFEAPEEAIAPGPPPSLSRGYVTFGSFNSMTKVSGATIRLWAGVLRAVPGSRLMMITVPEGRTRARLQEAFARQGIVAGRLDLRGRLTHQEFLRAHVDTDVALDTYPYHGTTTTAHTLWMGVPLITLAGSTHVSRVGVSMLANAGLSDLAAATEEEYVRGAIGLVRDTARLQALRAGLRQRMEATPMMDGARFTRALEAAYSSIWEEHCRHRE